jgi:hypothetical protein
VNPPYRTDPGAPASAPCSRPELAAALPRWDEVEGARRRELERHARACPSCGPELELLRRAEAWLVSQGPGRARACPTSGELYDYGRGPGARPLDDEDRDRVRAHLLLCRECEGMVATLAVPPPLPLEHPGAAEAPILAMPRRGSALHRRRLRLLVPLAAAAALILAVVWWRETLAGGPEEGVPLASAIRYPEPPLLRGDTPGELYFPRGRLLWLEGQGGAQGRLFADPIFELAPRPEASAYRATVLAHTGGAFDAGSALGSIESPSPVLTPDEELLAALRPGHYTWEAWSVENGLDIPLGRRDFDVVADADLAGQIAQASELPAAEAATRILSLLVEKGHEGDARAFARSLPASPERDEFLERLPGR